jgi:excisionase family DNA binding protein
MSDKGNEEDLLTTTEAARMLHVTRHTVARWAKLDLIPSIRLPGGTLRIRRSDVEKLLKREREDA